VSDEVLPSGTVTFVFTDIEGSTRLLERLGADYPSVLAQHDDILRETFTAHHGFVFGTEGDAMFVAFEAPSTAVAAAIDAQLRLDAAPWAADAQLRVRMGIHTGEAVVVGSTYVGMAAHVAARVCAAGHGGQVLVSEVTYKLAPSADAIDLGVHELKDVGEVGILQLAHRELPQEFPPLRTLASMPNNLPASVDAFVGREAEHAEVLTALSDNRLVTLTGAGGTGKTRLALEVAASALPSARDGVWFVPLAAVQDPDLVNAAVATALHLAEQQDEQLEDTLDRWLRPRQSILVLDNCEHLVSAVAVFADRALTRCPDLRVLCTSRESIGVRGEHTMLVPPLSVADDPGLTGVSDAVELFLVRAAAIAPSFDPGTADRAIVANICRQLDGLPLAIELAAPRLRALSLQQLEKRLDDRFRLLTGGRADHRGRKTLEEVVAWSYDLLSPPERALFSRLAVFRADFALEAAEAVLSGEGIDDLDVVDLLGRLVEKSLLTTIAYDSDLRYQLLQTLWQYARDRLVDCGELEYWTDRLLRWALARVDGVETALRTSAQDGAIQAAIQDAVAFRSAMERALEIGDDVSALRIVSAVPLGLNSERRQIITSLLDRVGDRVDGRIAGHAYAALGNMAFEQGDWEASAVANAEAVSHFLAFGSPRHAAWSMYLGAHSAWGAGDVQRVDELIEQAIECFRDEDDAMGLGYALWVASLRSSDLDAASRIADEADSLLRNVGSPMGVAHNAEGRGIIAFERGDVAEAARCISEAVQLFSAAGNLGCTAHSLEAAAVVVDALGSPTTAVELLGAAEELRQRSGHGHRPWEIRARRGAVEDLISPLPPDVNAAAVAAGRRHSLTSGAQAAIDSLGAAKAGTRRQSP
jgi:predicted ATPase/class 3 adenylate cyclase